jgi:four helix bundle protein
MYKTTNTGLVSNDFWLKDQIKRAAVSVSSNIVEGEESGRHKRGINRIFSSKG